MPDRDPQKDGETENDKGFRVVDRRHFTSEGELRPDAPPERAAPSETPPAAAGAASDQPPRPEARNKRSGPRDPTPVPHHDPRADPRAAPPSTDGGPGIDFLSFAASLATNALAALGLLPEEQARGLPRNPALAREYIDILAMLQAKTHGNLSRQEDTALGQMLADLRLQYVEITRRQR